MTNIGQLRYGVDERYLGLRGKVLVYVGDNQKAAYFAPYADGVVLHGDAGLRAAATLPAGTLRLVDRERYVSDRGSHETQLFPETAEEAVQQQLGIDVACLLAPSRFPADRSEHSIRALIGAGQEFIQASHSIAPTKPAFVPIVVRFDELADRRWVQPVFDSRMPIATIFAGYEDPLGTKEQLRGAVELIQAADIAMVLRCDLSAAGLMAHGASCGAIGVSSSVRHLYLPSRRKHNRRSHYLFVPSIANWMKVSFVEYTEAEPDLDDLFRCACEVCGPDGDVRQLLLPDAGEDMLDRHSVAAAVSLARRVIGSAAPTDQWHAVCFRAEEAYARLKQLGVEGPARPSVLGAWLDLLR
jgi:hypothetical protein